MTLEEFLLSSGWAPLARTPYDAPTVAWIHENGTLMSNEDAERRYGTVDSTCEEVTE